MRIAAIYDIHGNLPALEAVLNEMEKSKIDQVLVGGDILPGPMPRECLEVLLGLKIPVHFILGNGEVAVLNEMSGIPQPKLPETALEPIRWTADQLHQEHQELMAKWPKTITIETEELGKILFCHASPRNENEIFTKLTSEVKLIPIFESTQAEVVVCGHTHMQFDRKIGNVRVINAGSVGMPFGNTGAYWLLLDIKISFKNTHYHLQSAVNQFLTTSYPHIKQFVDSNVLKVPSEETMLAIFSKVEIS